MYNLTKRQFASITGLSSQRSQLSPREKEAYRKLIQALVVVTEYIGENPNQRSYPDGSSTPYTYSRCQTCIWSVYPRCTRSNIDISVNTMRQWKRGLACLLPFSPENQNKSANPLLAKCLNINSGCGWIFPSGPVYTNSLPMCNLGYSLKWFKGA